LSTENVGGEIKTITFKNKPTQRMKNKKHAIAST
jgi:hypothetical protein